MWVSILLFLLLSFNVNLLTSVSVHCRANFRACIVRSFLLPCNTTFLIFIKHIFFFLPTAMQMAGSGPTTTHAVSTICNVLQDFHHEKACFVAHSLGNDRVAMIHNNMYF